MLQNILIYSYFLLTSFYHPIHISITNITHIEETNQLEVSVRLFRDDLEMIINHKYDQNISLTNDKIEEEASISVNKYINDMLAFIVNNDTLSIDETIVDIDNLMLVANFNLKIVGELSSMEIINILMMDAFQDQKNLLIINHNDTEKGYQFTIDNYQQKIVL